MSVTNKPAIEAYIGASGSGKGVSIAARLRDLNPARLVIWDPRNEYGQHARPLTSLAALVADIRRAGPAGGFRLRYVPGGGLKLAEAFDLVCKVVFAAGNMVFVAEELSDVTTASHAPPAWRRITTQGRHAGLQILGASQRPTLIDKTFLANCTRVRCFQLGYDDDIEKMAKELRTPADVVAGLVTRDTPGGALIQALEYERRTRDLYAIQIKVNSRGATEERVPYVLRPGAGAGLTARRSRPI